MVPSKFWTKGKSAVIMQKILGNAKSVRSLLSQKYQIDYYQRDYNWETKQIFELVEDLSTRFLRDFDETPSTKRSGELWALFPWFYYHQREEWRKVHCGWTTAINLAYPFANLP